MGVQSTLAGGAEGPGARLSRGLPCLEMDHGAFGSVAAGSQIEPYSVRSIAGNSQQALYTKNRRRKSSFTGQFRHQAGP